MLGSKSHGPYTVSHCGSSVWSQKLQECWPQCKANHVVYLTLPANYHNVSISLGPQTLQEKLVIFRVILKFEEVNIFVPSMLTSLHKESWFQHQLVELDLAGMRVEIYSNFFCTARLISNIIMQAESHQELSRAAFNYPCLSASPIKKSLNNGYSQGSCVPTVLFSCL